MDMKLVINGLEVNVGIELANNIVNDLNDIEENKAIFHELAQHSSAFIRKEIAYKDNLTEDTARILLRDKDASVINNVLRSDTVKTIFNDDDFEYIMSMNNEEIIESFISYDIEEYSELSDTEKCFNEILALNNDYLTFQVANNYNTPKKILKKLTKHSDSDISTTAQKSLD